MAWRGSVRRPRRCSRTSRRQRRIQRVRPLVRWYAQAWCTVVGLWLPLGTRFFNAHLVELARTPQRSCSALSAQRPGLISVGYQPRLYRNILHNHLHPRLLRLLLAHDTHHLVPTPRCQHRPAHLSFCCIPALFPPVTAPFSRAFSVVPRCGTAGLRSTTFS
ncbi:hypothetical protein EXIGLDRAFT_224091 [Exidia glandulosa HHB12029]|uniref:Uncharacterized protein n=1 Tax=Exidia glandulosa HHB12029 TaxID=1314781 RepID=A0A165EBH1_EXIGL|nr:hypothetical protein EXIGLDRAFT_224091 [Exidia glandulosa HHB12029]